MLKLLIIKARLEIMAFWLYVVLAVDFYFAQFCWLGSVVGNCFFGRLINWALGFCIKIVHY